MMTSRMMLKQYDQEYDREQEVTKPNRPRKNKTPPKSNSNNIILSRISPTQPNADGCSKPQL